MKRTRCSHTNVVMRCVYWLVLSHERRADVVQSVTFVIFFGINLTFVPLVSFILKNPLFLNPKFSLLFSFFSVSNVNPAFFPSLSICSRFHTLYLKFRLFGFWLWHRLMPLPKYRRDCPSSQKQGVGILDLCGTPWATLERRRGGKSSDQPLNWSQKEWCAGHHISALHMIVEWGWRQTGSFLKLFHRSKTDYLHFFFCRSILLGYLQYFSPQKCHQVSCFLATGQQFKESCTSVNFY